MTTGLYTTGSTTRFLLPHPLAGLYARIESAQSPALKYGYTLRLAEGVFKFVALVNLADAIARGAPEGRVRDWLGKLERPAMGKWLALHLSTLNFLEAHGGPFLVEGMALRGDAWDELTRHIPDERNYYAHRLLAVSDAEARERLPTLREPVQRLLEKVQFLRDYLFGVCQRSECTGRVDGGAVWRNWWSASRGLSEVGEVRAFACGEVWPESHPLLLDPRRGRGLTLAPFFRWDGARARFEWLEDFSNAGIVYRHPIFEGTTPERAELIPDPADRDAAGLDRAAWLSRREQALYTFELGLHEGEANTLVRGSLIALGERWTVRGEIGRGAMGTVYEARDNRIGDHVALKVLHEHLVPSSDQVLRFLQEAQLLRGLRHPGLVRVHDAVSEGTSQVIVMELLEGEDFGAFIEARGPVPASEAVTVVGAVLDALAYAHEQSVIHRDVKPRNVMRCTDGTIKLLDFGIARSLDGVGLTRTETVSRMGTDAYMAPEQRFLGKADARSDVYAAGGLLWALLVGKDPVPYIPHVSTPASLQETAPGLPEFLFEVHARATKEEPALRFQTAAEMALALRAGASQRAGIETDVADIRLSTSPRSSTVDRRARTVLMLWLAAIAMILLRYVWLAVWPDPRAVVAGARLAEEARRARVSSEDSNDSSRPSVTP